MSLMKKVIATVCALAIVFTMSGCATITNATTVDGYDIRTGIYLFYEANTVGEAKSKVKAAKTEAGETSEVENLFAESIDNVSVIDWVKDETLDKIKRYVAIEKLFEANGLTLDEETTASINSSLTATWEESNWYLEYKQSEFKTLGALYESMGIGKTSYKDIMTNGAKENEVFLKYYDEGGIEAVPAADVNTYLTGNYARVKYVEIPKEDIYGAPYDAGSERETFIKNLVNVYVERLTNGEAFNQISAEYEKLHKEELAQVAAEEAAADEKLNADATSEAEAGTEEIMSEEIALELVEESELEKVISKSSTDPSEEFTTYVFEAALNTPLLYETSDSFYIIVRTDVLSNAEWVSQNKADALHNLKDEDFKLLLENTYANYSVENNEAAMSKYAPDKIIIQDIYLS